MKAFNKMCLDRSGHIEFLREKAVLKVFMKVPGVHPHWSSTSIKLQINRQQFIKVAL